jgi:hypothetical protein
LEGRGTRVRVEFRLADKRIFGTRNFTGWAAQAVDYTQTEWTDFGRLAVFACPSPLRLLGGSGWGEGAAGLMEHLLGQFGVTRTAPAYCVVCIDGEGVEPVEPFSLRGTGG